MLKNVTRFLGGCLLLGSIIAAPYIQGQDANPYSGEIQSGFVDVELVEKRFATPWGSDIRASDNSPLLIISFPVSGTDVIPIADSRLRSVGKPEITLVAIRRRSFCTVISRESPSRIPPCSVVVSYRS